MKSSIVYRVTVNHVLTPEMINAAGYVSIARHIEVIAERDFSLRKNLLRQSRAEKSLGLIPLSRSATPREAVEELKHRNLRAGTTLDLLALETQHPRVHHRFLVMALGTPYVDAGGYTHYPYSVMYNRRRHLFLLMDDLPVERLDKYGKLCRFLVVK